MKKVAIVGAGITGLSAAVYFNRVLGFNKKDIHIYSLRIGGEFLSGGLKYLKYTDRTREFVRMFTEYSVKKVNGSVLKDNQVFAYPEYLYYHSPNPQDPFDREDVQSKYWEKTRGDLVNFDNRCMNEPWEFRTELKIVPKDGMDSFIQKLSGEVSTYMLHTGNIGESQLFSVINDYDIIIYTIPFQMLAKIYGVELVSNGLQCKSLSIYKYHISKHQKGKIWWDYLYVPEQHYPFHRISIDKKTVFVEVNGPACKSYVDDAMGNLFYKLYDFHPDPIHEEPVQINGQITLDMKLATSQIPDKVILLGRFAEWNKRITWDKVIEKLYSLDIK